MGKRLSNLLFLAALCFFNLPLLSSEAPAARWGFSPERVLSGEWWRILTYAWAHVSAYHLILDGAATGILFSMIGGPEWRKWSIFLTCSLGSVLMAWGFAPQVREIGLCGLSGVAHGLIVVAMLDQIEEERKPTRVFAGVSIAAVTGKALLETYLGTSVFTGLHFGNIGTPIPACHLGGVIAGWLVGLAGLSAGHRANDEERFGASDHRIRQESFGRLVREVFFTGKEPHEGAAAQCAVIANGSTQNGVARLDRGQDGANGGRLIQIQLNLALDSGEIPQVKREDDSDHGNVCTSTERTAGRSRTMAFQELPLSAET